MRIATWNLERKKPTSPNGAAAVDHLRSLAPDVMVLTEARRSFPEDDAHMAWSRSWGSDDERKVVMWSKHPWTDVDDLGSAELPAARFVAGTTETPIGPVRVMGVCISWDMANVKYGDKNRRPWEDHITYCGVLRELIEAHDPSLPLIVAGDYNQRIPPTRGGAQVGAMASLLETVDLMTGGEVDGWEKPGIDHIAVRGLTPERVQGWPNVVDGVRCSDHGGAFADLRRGERPAS